MVRKLAVLVGGWFLLSAGPAAAQAPVSDQLYGTGVHAYFTGDHQRAKELLTSAIQTGGQDPRAWYFRGLACLKLQAPEDAKRDFQQGSKLESADQDRMYNISKALERVQGADRMVLEQYRAAARLKAHERAQQERKARYESLRREESRVLQQPPGAPPVPPGSKLPVAPDVKFGETGPAPKPEDGIFGTPPAKEGAPAKPAGETPAKAAAPAKPPEDDVFGMPPAKPVPPPPPPALEGKPTAPPAEKTPFEPDAPVEKPAGAKKPAVADVPAPEDPAKADFFARPAAKPGAKPVDGQPVDEEPSGVKIPSGKPTAKKAPGTKPRVGPAASDDADPFEGGAGSAAAKPKKGKSKKTAGEPSVSGNGGAFEDPDAAPTGKGTGKKPGTGAKRAASKKAAKDPDEDFGAGGAGKVPDPFEGGSEPAPKKQGGTK